MILYRRPYVESSVFIAFIRGEIREEGHDCKKVFDSILEAASRGKFLIYTSALTIAEVCKKKQFLEILESEIIDLRPYFRDPFIRIIELDREIGEDANLLCQSRLTPNHDVPKLRPNDAVHLASAQRAGCDYLLTYDKQLLGQKIDDLNIEWPTEVISGNSSGAATVYQQAGLPFTEPARLLKAPEIETAENPAGEENA